MRRTSHQPIAAAGRGDRIVADFDDLGTDFGNLPETYQATGLYWENWGWLDGAYAESEVGPNGFTAGVTTGNAVAYNRFGGVATVGTVDGANFDFSSVALTSAYRVGMKVRIEGFDDGNLEYSRVVRLDDDAARTFRFHFDDVDKVVFTAFGGKPDPDQPTSDSFQFAADHMVFGASKGSIAGRLFADADADGVRDKGEGWLAGRTVFADGNRNGVLDDYEQSAVTDHSGRYTIAGVSFGTYDVWQVLPDGWSQTSPLVRDNGYQVADATYNWVEIGRPANALTFAAADDAAVAVTLAKPISFYGDDYSTLYVATNGVITFNEFFADLGANSRLPDHNFPNGVIAPFWDDLTLGETGRVYLLEDKANDRIVVEWRDVTLFRDPSVLLTFEAIIGRDGSIVFQYKDLGDLGSSATVGLEKPDESIGTTFSFDEAVLHERQAIAFVPGSQQIPVSVTVDSGKVSAGVDFGSIEGPLPASQALFGGDSALPLPAWHVARHDDMALAAIV